jgi:hypothetical protein
MDDENIISNTNAIDPAEFKDTTGNLDDEDM